MEDLCVELIDTIIFIVKKLEKDGQEFMED